MKKYHHCIIYFFYRDTPPKYTQSKKKSARFIKTGVSPLYHLLFTVFFFVFNRLCIKVSPYQLKTNILYIQAHTRTRTRSCTRTHTRTFRKVIKKGDMMILYRLSAH